eukprot:CAMPEP_0177531986 /NCGR_PEP_ID=MMETSP0369-20130122/54364_1 /TAXON_ID=447022 ORGANISM="Scrippsiella hangoei-like, Strain SHHI-4" /NCGR_SAMPLE_ID=MMETSP0369 /ASSEMBLY_ACC=CAM_ASM_000364 /LENGTH=99 /DNA_ID=CAMNT_0019013223 /DNA_START=100 /DNA_END=399 /DNA_ORIENTATION=-
MLCAAWTKASSLQDAGTVSSAEKQSTKMMSYLRPLGTRARKADLVHAGLNVETEELGGGCDNARVVLDRLDGGAFRAVLGDELWQCASPEADRQYLQRL